MEIAEAITKRDQKLKQLQDLNVKRMAVKGQMKTVALELDPLLAQIQQHKKDHPSPGTQTVGE